MKNTIAASLLVLVSIQANAYERTTSFTVDNPGVLCHVGTESRSAGVRTIVLASETNVLLKRARTTEGTGIATSMTTSPATFDYNRKGCQDLKPVPSVLRGMRTLYVQKLEHRGECSTIVVEHVSFDLGAGNPAVVSKTAWPVVGNDLSAYNKANCNLTDEDYERAFNRM